MRRAQWAPGPDRVPERAVCDGRARLCRVPQDDADGSIRTYHDDALVRELSTRGGTLVVLPRLRRRLLTGLAVHDFSA